LLPRRHEAHFESSPRHEYGSLARLLGDILRRINKALGLPPYNLLIHTAPLVESATEFYHWHVEIIPKLTKVAGFEWATGFYLNPTSPEEAAQVLRDARGWGREGDHHEGREGHEEVFVYDFLRAVRAFVVRTCTRASTRTSDPSAGAPATGGDRSRRPPGWSSRSRPRARAARRSACG